MNDRLPGLAWGSFIGDALAMPVHWYYDRAALHRDYDADEYLTRYIAFMLTPGQHRDTYVEEYHRKFFTAYARGQAPRQCAGGDIHIGGLAHVGILCAFLAADPNPDATRAAVREHITLTHRSDEVLAAGDALARILCDCAAGADLREAIFQHGGDWFSRRKAERWSREPDEVVIGQRVSPACYIADAFPASLYLAWKYAGDFEAGVIANTNVGGDNCHRAAVVGSLLAASAPIPQPLVKGLAAAASVTALLT